MAAGQPWPARLRHQQPERRAGEGLRPGRPDDAAVLSLFKGVDHWIVGVADDDAIVLSASAVCQGARRPSRSRTRSSPCGNWARLLQKETPKAPSGGSADPLVMARSLLTNLRVDQANGRIEVRAEGFGTLADFDAFVQAEADVKARKREGPQDEAEDTRFEPMSSIRRWIFCLPSGG